MEIGSAESSGAFLLFNASQARRQGKLAPWVESDMLVGADLVVFCSLSLLDGRYFASSLSLCLSFFLLCA